MSPIKARQPQDVRHATGPASFVISGDSIASSAGTEIPLLPNPASGVSNTLANRLLNRANVRDGSSGGGTGNAGYATVPGHSWTKWLEVLSGNRCRLVRNSGLTGSTVGQQYLNMADPTSPYYLADLQQFPIGFWIQEGAGGDDQAIPTPVATVEANLDMVYQRFATYFPDALGIAWTQTPTNPNDDAFRRPINQFLRDYAFKNRIRLFDAETIMMEGLTGFVSSSPTPNPPFSAAVANPLTITVGTPTTFTYNNHTLAPGDPVQFQFFTSTWTAGTPPTGLVQDTIYYVMLAGLTANAFQVSATPGGPSITTSGALTGNAFVKTPKYQSADALHQSCSSAYVMAKKLLEIVGPVLPEEDNFVNDYAADPQVQTANGGFGTAAMMAGTLGAGNTPTGWAYGGAAGAQALLPREDNYGNWFRLQQVAGQTSAVQLTVYRIPSFSFPAGSIIQLECELRWPYGDLQGCTEIKLYFQTNLSATLAFAETLYAQGLSPPRHPYKTPKPGERWKLQTTPIVLPSGVTSHTTAFSFYAVSGTVDVGRFSLRRLDL